MNTTTPVTTMARQSCVKCPKGLGEVICGSCGQWFCFNHLVHHRQELSRQMYDLTIEHDQLQHDLIADDSNRQQHPLFSRVDQWESDATQRIKQVANEVRDQLRDLLSRSKKRVEESLTSISQELQESRRMESYTETDLTRWTSQLKELREQLEGPSTIEMKNDQVQAPSPDIPLITVSAKQDKVLQHITNKSRWSTNGRTVAGGRGEGSALNQLNCPSGLDIDDDGSLFIADMDNHRIVRWKPNANQGEIIAGGKGRGSRTDQLNEPVAVLIDRINRSLIISDLGNQRVMRWSLDQRGSNGGVSEVIISNIRSYGLAMDNERTLYVSDNDRCVVRRYGREVARGGVIVAGGNGVGGALDQLNCPRKIFVDAEHSVYVSDWWNHRVVKWAKGAREGVVVAGCKDKRNQLEQFFLLHGIFVDQTGSVYVVDQAKHRLTRWMKGATEGEVIVGGNGRGSENDQFNEPVSILLDNRENLYVVDRNNDRIQRFDLQ